ncbi:MAG: hypothetical protein P8J20_18685 [Novosphingobium sp.]|nr:hypothetical protein [Novosphingobium sp.]
MTEISGKVAFVTGGGGPFQRSRTAPAYHKVELFRPPEEVAEMVLSAVRRNRAFALTDDSYRDAFIRQYVDPVMQAFEDVAEFDQKMS